VKQQPLVMKSETLKIRGHASGSNDKPDCIVYFYHDL